MYLLDADICSYYLRGRHGLEEKCESVGPAALHISRVTVAELLVLAHKSPSSRVNQARVEEVARTLVFVELDEPARETLSLMKADPLKAGRVVGDFDILLASIARTRDLIVVTNNERHFQPTGVPLENWVARAS
jgi:tRNA(fMet)-specific endonuclease VapC